MKKGYKDSFSVETHKVEEVNRGLYTVDGSLHTRKDLQLVKGNVIKHLLSKSKTRGQTHGTYAILPQEQLKLIRI